MQDPVLFDALVGCLSATGSGVGSGYENNDRSELSLSNKANAGHQQHIQHHGGGGGSGSLLNSRKRANSVCSDEIIIPSKAMKLTHSPVPSTRLYHHRHHVTDATANSEYSPKFDVHVVAATILYMAFSHLDHWPVPLVKAYAEDCFGQRLWVGDDRCKLLVENLRLAHTGYTGPVADVDMEDASLAEEASKVVESYNKLLELLAEEEEEYDVGSPSQIVRRESLSTVSSVVSSAVSCSQGMRRSNSRDETDSTRADYSGEKKKKKKTASNASTTKNDAKSAKTRNPGKDGSSSSSGEEDEEVIVTTKSAGDESESSPKKKAKVRPRSSRSPNGGAESSSNTESPSPTSPMRMRLYPLAQKRLNLTRVRQRFFGANRQHAHAAISSSLSERLDSKAKQNSSLLQSLHWFTGIPTIRSLVAGNLEKWLQSPGLSGLARTLFAATVQQIENVVPPNPADLEAIHKVLSMRLKANQVRI
jgi:integrator complex subunit 1